MPSTVALEPAARFAIGKPGEPSGLWLVEDADYLLLFDPAIGSIRRRLAFTTHGGSEPIRLDRFTSEWADSGVVEPGDPQPLPVVGEVWTGLRDQPITQGAVLRLWRVVLPVATGAETVPFALDELVQGVKVIVVHADTGMAVLQSKGGGEHAATVYSHRLGPTVALDGVECRMVVGDPPVPGDQWELERWHRGVALPWIAGVVRSVEVVRMH